MADQIDVFGGGGPTDKKRKELVGRKEHIQQFGVWPYLRMSPYMGTSEGNDRDNITVLKVRLRPSINKAPSMRTKAVCMRYIFFQEQKLSLQVLLRAEALFYRYYDYRYYELSKVIEKISLLSYIKKHNISKDHLALQSYCLTSVLSTLRGSIGLLHTPLFILESYLPNW